MHGMNVMVPPPDASELDPGPASTLGHLDALPVGTRLAEFEIQGLLGVGGFGLVYRAYDTSLHRSVAIKEYMPVVLAGRSQGNDVVLRSKSDSEAYAFGLQSFIDEARLLAQFDHPSLVKVYRFWEANHTAYMVMPLYKGVTLKQARQRMSTPPPEEWLRTVLWSVLQGLHVLHRSHTLHRDISPDNIFLQEVGPPVLLDLGAARRALGDHSRKMTAVLKVHYAPIEQFAEVEGLEQGPWTDLYSLAAVVYGCLSNEAPTPSTTRLIRDTLVPVRQLAGTVKRLFGQEYSEEFTRTIQHALALQPANRPQSLAAFVTEMKLTAPPRLSKFEWRAALTFPTPGVDDVTADYSFQPTVAMDSNLGELDAPRGGNRGLGVRWPLWLGAGLVVAAGLWFAGGRPGLLARQAPPDAPAAVEAVSPPVAAAVPSSPAPGMDPVESPVVAPPVPVPATEVANPGGTTSGARVLRAEPAERVAHPPKPAPVTRSAGATPANPTPANPTPGVREPVAVPAPKAAVPAPAPAAARVPAPASQAQELCADAGFLRRPLCIHNECKKPENAALAVCVEDRRRYPE